jgi:hypothetical protein
MSGKLLHAGGLLVKDAILLGKKPEGWTKEISKCQNITLAAPLR